MVCSTGTAEAFVMKMVEPGRFWVRSVWSPVSCLEALELRIGELCERTCVGGARVYEY